MCFWVRFECKSWLFLGVGVLVSQLTHLLYMFSLGAHASDAMLFYDLFPFSIQYNTNQYFVLPDKLRLLF